MTPLCRELQERMAAEGAAGLREDVAAQRHLEECTACLAVLEALPRLDAALAAMPEVDASEETVRQLMDRVKSDGAVAPSAARMRQPRPLLWASVAAASVAVVGLWLWIPRSQRPLDRVMPATTLGAEPQAAPAKDKEVAYSAEERERLKSLGYVTTTSDLSTKMRPSAAATPAFAGPDRSGLVPEADGVPGGVVGGVPGGVVGGKVGGLDVASKQGFRVGGQIPAPRILSRGAPPAYPQIATRAASEGVVLMDVTVGPDGHVKDVQVLEGSPMLTEAAVAAVRQYVYEPVRLNGQPVSVIVPVSIRFTLDREKPSPSPSPSTTSDAGAGGPASAFLAERAQTADLAFQPSRGYWANTYVPGDPLLNALRARLASWDRTSLQALAGMPLRLHDAARPVAQPFDAPRGGSALALFLQADSRALDGPRRMLVQVGLKAAPASGARPPLRLALVLDLRDGLPTADAAAVRALVLALAEAVTVGDRVSLVVAGQPGGVIVGRTGFRHGPLTVALDRLLLARDAEGGGLGLPDAVAAAYREATRCDSPQETLGASAVVLVATRPLGDQMASVADLAGQGALAGVPMSVVGIGHGPELAEMDALALAGQGSRRVLAAADDARRLVDLELASAADVVARAVRLRIRLAPGVQLVGIIGSRRLDAAQAEQVRGVERSIDLRLAQQLGLERDRGEDEDGIQIVIPAFHAGDTHAIQLDVVASGPGAIVDVGMRYKDLVALRNDESRASLALPSGTPAPSMGPLERNVRENLLARRLGLSLAAAAACLDAADPAGAARAIEEARALRASLLETSMGGSAELTRDVALLTEYGRALARAAELPPQWVALADSLRVAARSKQLPHDVPTSTL